MAQHRPRVGYPRIADKMSGIHNDMSEITPAPVSAPEMVAENGPNVENSRRSGSFKSTRAQDRGLSQNAVDDDSDDTSSDEVDLSGANVGGEKEQPNSHILVPQSSTSPDDPLNWSWAKKHAVLLALIPGCLLSDFALTYGTTLFGPQAAEWHVPAFPARV